MHSDFVTISDLVNKGTPHLEAEMQVLGMDHPSVGEALLRNWNIPEIICNIVKSHHAPHLSTQAPVLSSVVHLADYMTQKLQMGNLKWDAALELNENIFTNLNFKDLTDLGKFIENYREPLVGQLDSLRYLI
jgi:HD-like signal output (HDOD) protein